MLSNTIWPREWHVGFFERDGVYDLVDGDVYTSEIPWTKPSPRAFGAAMEAVGVDDPAACVYVGDRLYDDVWGARAGRPARRSTCRSAPSRPTRWATPRASPTPSSHALAEVPEAVRRLA